MSRLIDADELKDYLKKLTCSEGADATYRAGVNDAICNLLPKIVDSRSTVDAVPVVRCGECKYGSPHPIDNASVFCIRGMNRHLRMKKDNFCSYGKRNDEQN